MGKRGPRLETRGAYPIFYITFDSEVKYFKYYTSVKFVLEPLLARCKEGRFITSQIEMC